MSDSSVVVKVADAEAPQNTFVAREANCCWVSTFTTSVLDGTAKLDKAVCCGLWRDRLDIAALRNVVQWRARTLQAGACARSGNIALQLAGSGTWAMNLFKPALFGGWKDAFKVDAVLRAASLADRPPVPAYLATPEMAAERSWARKTGCCGSTAAACTCCCCETNEQTVRVGPADSLTTVHDKEHKLYCTRGLDVRGTNTGEIGFIAAEAPIGCCGITNDKPDFGSCSCSCDEQAVFVPTASPGMPLSVNTNKSESEVITTNVLSRVLADPEVIAEEKLRTYVSQHSCYGRKGELTITNKRVEYVGFKHPPFCCETVAPGVPNLCCVLCQVHTRQTIPLDKVTDTVVEADGPCKVSHDYATYAWWAIQKAVEELTSLGLVGFFVWIFVFVYYLVASIIAPLIMLACCFPACRQSAVSIGAAAGEIKVSLTSPADTGGLSMRDFAVDVINVVRKAQEENKAKLRAAELKLSASGAAK